MATGKQAYIRVLLYAPTYPLGIEAFIEADYRNYQAIVGGLFTCPPAGKVGVDIIANDEGLILGLPRNRYIPILEQWIHGAFIVARADEETGNYVDLSDDDIRWARGMLDQEVDNG